MYESDGRTFHDLPSCCEAFLPVRLPFKQVARVQSVRPQLKDASELPWRARRPEAKLLHQRQLLTGDQALQLLVKLGELGVVLDVVNRGVITGIALVLPDVNCAASPSASSGTA